MCRARGDHVAAQTSLLVTYVLPAHLIDNKKDTLEHKQQKHDLRIQTTKTNFGPNGTATLDFTRAS